MARYVGDQNDVGFFYESGTYAVESGVTLQPIGKVTEHAIDESVNTFSVRFLGGTTRNVEQFEDGPLDFTGTLTYHPQDWKMFFFALGSNVDNGSPSPYTHSITEINSNDQNNITSGVFNPFISFTIQESQVAAGTGQNFIRTVRGCMVNTLTLSASQGEMATMEVEYIAQGGSDVFSSGAKTALTVRPVRSYLWNDFSIDLPSGTTFDGLISVELSVNNNLEPPHYLNGSRVIEAPIPLNRDYELSLTFHGTSEHTKTLYDSFFIPGSEFNAMLTVSASTGSREAFFIMSGCKLTDMDAPTALEGVNEQTITIVPKQMIVEVNDLVELYNPY